MQFQPNLNYIIEYAPHEILIDLPIFKDSGRIHILNDAEITSLHTHNCLEIGFCYEGAGIFIIDNQVLPFSTGDLCVIFRDQMHKAQSQQGKTSLWKYLYIDLDLLLSITQTIGIQALPNMCLQKPLNMSILSSKEFPDISFIVQSILTELEEKASNYKALITSLLCALLLKIARLTQLSETVEIKSELMALGRVIPALNYISQNYIKTIHIKELAALCNESCSSFRRHFGKSMHMSPLDYIVKIRIQMASILLKSSDTSILEISEKVGFNSLSSFNRHFKKMHGISPRVWRAKSQLGE